MKAKSTNAAFALIAAAAFNQFQRAIGIRMPSKKTPKARRGWTTPHIGAKEQERAKRFYMVDTHPSGAPRSTPTMQQHSKRAHAARLQLVK